MQKTLKIKAYFVDDGFTKQYCERAFGVRRWIWNWTLSRFMEEKKKSGYQPTSWYGFDKELTALLKTHPDRGFVWLVDNLITRHQMQEVEKDVKASFALCKNKAVRKLSKGNAKPHFKSRKDSKQSFRMIYDRGDGFRVESDHMISFQSSGRCKRCQLRVSESLAFLRKDNIKLTTLTVKRQAGVYWVCISYEIPNHTHLQPCKQGKLGIDLGVVKSVVSFDGQTVSTVQFNTEHSRHLDRLSKKNDKAMSRCQVGSRRYRELNELKQKRAAKAARIRQYRLETYTTEIAQNYSEIKVDNFSFEGSKQVVRKKQREELYRCMKYEFMQRLAQKCEETGAVLTEVNHAARQRTTTVCSCCDSTHVKILQKGRRFVCRRCGLEMDRDENAARNSFKLI